MAKEKDGLLKGEQIDPFFALARHATLPQLLRRISSCKKRQFVVQTKNERCGGYFAHARHVGFGGYAAFAIQHDIFVLIIDENKHFPLEQMWLANQMLILSRQNGMADEWIAF